MHRLYEGKPGQKKTKFYLCDGNEVCVADEFPSFPATDIRSTAVNASDTFLVDLAIVHQHKIFHCHFHSTGIKKGSTPEEIVKSYWELPDKKFREFHPRQDIAILRSNLAIRNALMQFHGDSLRKIQQLSRNGEDVAHALEALAESKKVLHKLPSPYTGKNVAPDTLIAQMAEKIPECQIFNKIAGIADGWIWAASIVALSGGLERFATVGSFIHYCGDHTKDGKTFSRKKGSPVDWNPQLKTANWQGVDSILKNRKNPWRQKYEARVEIEKLKDPNITVVYANNKARRWVRKEILKSFYFAVNPKASGGSISPPQFEPNERLLSPELN